MKNGRRLLFTAFFYPVVTADAGIEYFPILKGSYLGQKPSWTKSEVFAPGIVSIKYNEVSNRTGNRNIYWPDAWIIEGLKTRRDL